MQGQSGGALNGLYCHLVDWPWDSLGRAGQGLPPSVFSPGAALSELQSNLRWLLLVPDLGLT